MDLYPAMRVLGMENQEYVIHNYRTNLATLEVYFCYIAE